MKSFPICRYTPETDMIRGIFKTVDEFLKYKKSMEHLTYKRENGPQYVIYAWNLFSTLYFVQECLKRFGKENDKFILVYRDKTEQEKNQVATDASVVEEEKKTVMVLCIALQLNVTLFKYANEILAYSPAV